MGLLSSAEAVGHYMEVADERRYAKDLLGDPLIRFDNDTFVLWAIAGLAAAFGLGVALTGRLEATGLARSVVRVDPGRRERKAIAHPA